MNAYLQNFITNTFCSTNESDTTDKDFLNFLQVYFVLTAGLMSVNVANYAVNYFSNLGSFKSLIYKTNKDDSTTPSQLKVIIPDLDEDSSEDDSSSEDEDIITEVVKVNDFGKLLNKIAN